MFDSIGDDFSTYFNDYAVQGDIQNDWQWICFCPMSAFALHPDGSMAVDFVGRAENLEDDIASLARLIGISINKAPDENVRNGICGTEPKYLKHFDRRSIATANSFYRRDFELFGYQMLDPDSFPESV